MRCWSLFVILLIALTASSQTKPAAGGAESGERTGCSAVDEGSLRAVSEVWKDAYNGKDAARVAALYTENAYYLTQHFAAGIIHPRTNIQAYVQRGIDANYRVDSIEIIALHCTKDFAYTITRYRSTNGGDKAMGVNLVVLRKVEGKWLIVAHEATVPDPVTAVQSLDPGKPR